jgi:hypothetical protein
MTGVELECRTQATHREFLAVKVNRFVWMELAQDHLRMRRLVLVALHVGFYCQNVGYT